MQCTYDSGSMTGNVPVCDQVATHALTYKPACYPALTAELCGFHVKSTEGRVWPDRIVSVERI